MLSKYLSVILLNAIFAIGTCSAMEEEEGLKGIAAHLRIIEGCTNAKMEADFNALFAPIDQEVEVIDLSLDPLRENLLPRTKQADHKRGKKSCLSCLLFCK